MANSLCHLTIDAKDFCRYAGQELRSLDIISTWSRTHGEKASVANKLIITPLIFIRNWLFSSIFISFTLISLSSFSILGLEFIRYSGGNYYENLYTQDFSGYLKHLAWEKSYFIVLPNIAYYLFFIGILLGFRGRVKQFRAMTRKENKFRTLIYLMEEIRKYNRLVKDIAVKVELSEVREDYDRGKMLSLEQILFAMKNQFIKALKVERIIRENASVITFNIKIMEEDPVFLRSIEIFREIQEFNDPLLNSLIEIEANVRREINRVMPL
jgi:hypothetical protein